MVGESAPMRALFTTVERFAPHKANVIVMGESGSGKQLVSRALHRLGPFPDGPFVCFNCSNLSEGVAESQLIGHVKGAFAYAHETHLGCFQQANGDTLVLDDIGELPLSVQSKLVRIVDSSEVRPIGANESERLDLRLVATTRYNLRNLVAAGTFRDDLYFRLDVGSIHLPALREHIEDVDALTAHFIGHYNREFDKRIRNISYPALDMLRRHRWPGNVRELAHIIERATLLSDGECTDLCDLPMNLLADVTGPEPAANDGPECTTVGYNSPRSRSYQSKAGPAPACG
jgi:DNA-binding NtrC family response regulator